jgi:hypothetical protein
MVKLTKRKGFNFFRSYYDVYNELEKPEDKLAFIDALLDRQFLGIKPTNLTGMAKFAYISQTNSIDSQVKGFEDKTGIILNPSQGGGKGGSYTPCLQVEEKEKEKEKEKEEVKEKNKNKEFFNSCLTSDAWLEQIAMKTKCKKSYVVKLLNEFNDDLCLKEDYKHNLKDFKTHFVNWFNIKSKESRPNPFKNEVF